MGIERVAKLIAWGSLAAAALSIVYGVVTITEISGAQSPELEADITKRLWITLGVGITSGIVAIIAKSIGYPSTEADAQPATRDNVVNLADYRKRRDAA